MADILRNLSRGDRISLISAGQVNLWNEAARRVRGEAFDLGFDDAERTRNSAIIDVRNNTADDLPRFAVVALSGMGVEPTENENQSLANPFMEGTAPGNPNDRETIGILVDPLSAGTIGRAVIVGATWVKVSVSTGEENYQYCKVSNGVTANMVMSSALGPAKILWKESGTGIKNAYVLIEQALNHVIGSFSTYDWTPSIADWTTHPGGTAGPLTQYEEVHTYTSFGEGDFTILLPDLTGATVPVHVRVCVAELGGGNILIDPQGATSGIQGAGAYVTMTLSTPWTGYEFVSNYNGQNGWLLM